MRLLLIGALLFGLFGLSAAQAASFDCTAAKADDEKAVCARQELSDLDVRMATMYDMTLRLVAMGVADDLRDGQRAFLGSRSACGSNEACIHKAYMARIEDIEAVFNRIAENGPF